MLCYMFTLFTHSIIYTFTMSGTYNSAYLTLIDSMKKVFSFQFLSEDKQ